MSGTRLWIRNILGKLPFVVDLPNGDKWYRVSGKPAFNQYADYAEKLNMVFSNPAVLTIFKLQCDLFSQAKVTVKQNEKELPNDQFIKMIKKPNPFQGQRQWLWDFMFTNMLGCSYMLSWSRVASTSNVIYWLYPDKLTFPPELLRKLDRHYFSKAEIKRLLENKVEYRYQDGKTVKYKLKDIKPFADLTNGNGNWYGSSSAIDALYKIITNSEEALNAKNVNLKMAGKYMVSGDQSKGDATYADMLPMGEDEKSSLVKSIEKGKTVTAVRSMIDIKRFVEDIAKLKLDESYLADYFAIGKMYGIPRDVLEAYQSSTHENQEKARGSHVGYTLSPKGEDLSNGIEEWFGYDDEGKEIALSWDHLPFVQVFEKDKAKVKEGNAKAMEKVVKMGANPNEVGADFGFDYKFKENDHGEN